jgi:hypothetical protein
MSRKKDLGEPSPEELIEALQHVNEALHQLGGAWQILPGKVRARIVGESQRIEDLLDRAEALPVPPPRAPRDRRLRHLPVPKPVSSRTTQVLGRKYRKARSPTPASNDLPTAT